MPRHSAACRPKHAVSSRSDHMPALGEKEVRGPDRRGTCLAIDAELLSAVDAALASVPFRSSHWAWTGRLLRGRKRASRLPRKPGPPGSSLRCPLASGSRLPPGDTVRGKGVPQRSAIERRCSWGRRVATVERMTIQRMDHVGIVVDDLAAATAFFVELGLELQGEGQVEGGWVDRVVGLEGVRAEIAMVETPDGHGRLELTKFHAPPGRDGDRHRRRTPRAFAISRSRSTTSTPPSLACEHAAESSSATSSATETAIGSATSAARRGSSSSWRSRSAEGSGRPPSASPASVPREAGSRCRFRALAAA